MGNKGSRRRKKCGLKRKNREKTVDWGCREAG